MTTTAIHFEKVTKEYHSNKGLVRALIDLNLDIQAGEFFALLGPSGSGKTTCLRLLGGFETLTRGHISLFGQSVEQIPPFNRPIATVFQDYALFNHMTVLDNVAYGLMVKGVDKTTRCLAAQKMLNLVQLSGFAERKPAALSGGQKQRVALARALLIEPKILLLDEPLSALDLKLREEMRLELKNLQKNLGINFIYVTHDQGEALAMADRIAIFNQGKLQQVGTATEIYETPRSRFVAEFVGRANLLSPLLSQECGLPRRFHALRAEQVEITADNQAVKSANQVYLSAIILDRQYQGSFWHVGLQLKTKNQTDKVFLANVPIQSAQAKRINQWQKGQVVEINFARDAAHALEE